MQWYTSINPAMWEVKAGGSQIQGQIGQLSKTLYQKIQLKGRGVA